MVFDFSFVLYWWLVIFGIGVVFYPLTRILFGKFWDKGYAFSKILGILLVSYVVWFLGSLKILPFLNETIWLVVLGAVAGNYWLGRSRFKGFKKEIRENWKIFVFEEVLFFFCLAFWTFVRGFQPDIQGLEKFMDYGFVNSILRSRWFPPADMWLAGEAINYYYFGHLVTAVLTKLSGIDSAITYNLMIATIFALSFTASFSLGANLIFLNQNNWKLKMPASRDSFGMRNSKLPVVAGLLTAFLLTLGGNLHPLWYLIKHGNYRSYWYPDATRFIVQLFGAADNTIHEFPIYSFVVADLHGHLLNLPFVLLFLSLVATIFLNKKIFIYLFISLSLLLGTFYMTNAWDFPIYFLVLGLVIFYFNYLKYGLAVATFYRTGLLAVSCLLLAILFSLPFHLNFKQIAGGLALVDFRSPIWMLPVLWGFPLFLTLSYLVFRKKIHHFFVSIILLVSWLLILLPEIIYLKDIYIHSYQRANTMFKLTYQSFVMFSLIAGYITVKVLSNLKKGLLKILFASSYSLLTVFVLIYPYFAVRSYYGLKNYRGIYGLDYLQKSYPDDYQAVLWLKKNIPGQPVIVEAVGESYTDFARVSANTGLPTILGWRVHEWLWRGSFDEAGKRTGEVQEIYESSDISQTKALLNKYQVSYIFVGDLERKQYSKLQESKFETLGEQVFISGQTKIYQIKNLQ